MSTRTQEQAVGAALEKRKVYGVFMHEPNRNGYVVRSGIEDGDEPAYYPAPYTHLEPVSEYRSEAAAERRAKVLNAQR